MTRPTFARTNSHGRGLLKTSKPSPMKLSKGTCKPSSPTSKSTKRDSRADIEEEDWKDMAGLPNYCTTCEKQIITPNASLLYCSEACRKKDGSRPISACIEAGFPSPSPAATFEGGSHYPDIVPQQSPTPLRPLSTASEDSLSDRPGMTRSDSEAAQYLSQFLSTSASTSSLSRRPLHPGYGRSAHSTLPSLSHTPNSMASPPSSYSYSSISRTAPNRPMYWNDHRRQSTRSIDLVMPVTASASLNRFDGQASLRSQASTATAFRVIEGELTYEKKAMDGTPREGTGSLKQLFDQGVLRRTAS